VDDELEFAFHRVREVQGGAYQLEVGDVIRIESVIDASLTREVTIQPDGTVDLLYLGPVRVVRSAVEEVAKDLNQRYAKFYKVTDVNVLRVKTQTRLDDLRAALDRSSLTGGQASRVRISPEGTISLPAIGSVPAHGLTLDELKREADARYRALAPGVEVTPSLVQRAPRYVFVVGEARRPGRYDLTGPTTVLQSLALAGGWNGCGDLGHVMIFRRADDWGLIATRLDLRGAASGQCPSPADDVWVRDSDVIVVPKVSGHWSSNALGHLFGREHCDAGGCSVIAE
jgi:polysaccharide export outer membrane protein